MININFSKIKLPKFIIKIDKKGWFKGLGLHHASITVGWILLFSLFGIGWFGCGWAMGWYGCKEYGSQIYPPKVFELMDFLSPLIVVIIYNLVF
jgi:hypothetical protein